MRFLIVLLIGLASVNTLAEPEVRFIAVSAEGYVEAVPDTLHLTISISHTARSLAEAREQTEVQARKVLALAKETAVPKEDIDSSRISAFPQYEWRNQQRYYVGETVHRNIDLTLRDLDRYGELIGKLSEHKINGIGQPRLSHSDLPELQLRALESALDRGRDKASAIAARIGARLGSVLSVEEGGARTAQPRVAYAEAAMARDSNESAGISFAKQRINALVQMRFALE